MDLGPVEEAQAQNPACWRRGGGERSGEEAARQATEECTSVHESLPLGRALGGTGRPAGRIYTTRATMWIARIVSFFSPPSSVFPAGGPPHGVGDEARRAEAVTAGRPRDHSAI